jgi:4-amino-4-deoxy-L-arabinose transferase-like glycosyltransferase
MYLTILYLISRIWDFLKQPPFVDELLYIRWTDSIASNWMNPWITVTEDGQPPLFFWLGAIIKNLTNLDTLMILRLISIFFGLTTLLILLKTVTKIFDSKLANIVGLIYVIFPMFLWYDRLAMRESMITLAALLVVYGLISRFFLSKPSGIYISLLGFIFGIATKGTGIIFIPIILLTYAIYHKKIKLEKSDLISFSIFVSTITLLYIGAHSIISKGETFLFESGDLLKHIYLNTYSTISWVLDYSTLPVLLVGMWGFATLIYQKSQISIYYSLVLITTLFIETVVAKVYFPRYFLWTMLFWIIFISKGIQELFSKPFGKIVAIFTVIPILILDFNMIAFPFKAKLPEIERWQYLTGWPSGYGIKDMALEIQKMPIDTLVVEENNENCRTGIPYYSSLSISTVFLNDKHIINQHIADGKKVYACLNILASLPWDLNRSADLIVDRPEHKSSLRLYKLDSQLPY